MHGRKYANAARTCGVIFANSAFTADDIAATLGFPRERIVVAHPGIGAEYHAGRARRRARRRPICSPWRRSSRGRTSARSSRPSRSSRTEPELELCVVGGAGWGEQPQLDRPGVVRLGRVSRRRARRALPRRGRGRLPVAVRGLRDADHRGDGLRRARRRLRASLARRGLRATRRCAATPRAPRRWPRRSARRSRRRERAPRARARPRRHVLLGRGPASSSSRGTGDSRRHSTRRRFARRAPAPPATCAGCSTTSRCRCEETSFPATLAAAHARRRRALVPAARSVEARRPPLPDLPRAVLVDERRSSSRFTTSPSCGIPEWFNRWTRALLAPGGAAGRAAPPTA